MLFPTLSSLRHSFVSSSKVSFAFPCSPSRSSRGMVMGPRHQVPHTSLRARCAGTPDARAPQPGRLSPRGPQATRSGRTAAGPPGSPSSAHTCRRVTPVCPCPATQDARAAATDVTARPSHTPPPPRVYTTHVAIPTARQGRASWPAAAHPGPARSCLILPPASRRPARSRRARSRGHARAAPHRAPPRRALPKASSVAHPGQPRAARRLARKRKARAAHSPHSPLSRAGSECASFRCGAQR